MREFLQNRTICDTREVPFARSDHFSSATVEQAPEAQTIHCCRPFKCVNLLGLPVQHKVFSVPNSNSEDIQPFVCEVLRP